MPSVGSSRRARSVRSFELTASRNMHRTSLHTCEPVFHEMACERISRSRRSRSVDLLEPCEDQEDTFEALAAGHFELLEGTVKRE